MIERLRHLAGEARRRARPARDVGLALSPDELVALTVQRRLLARGPERVLRRPLDAGPGGEGWPALAPALRELRRRLGHGDDARLRAHVALLPPLGRCKVVRLPAAPREALRRLVTREAERHFLPAPREPAGDGVPLERERDGPVRAVAACADGAVVDAVLAALEAAGFEPGLVTPAAWAALEGARSLAPDAVGEASVLELRGTSWRQDLRVQDGRLRSVAAAPAEPDDAATAAGGTPGEDATRLRVAGEGDGLHGLGPEALAAFGTRVQPEDGPLLLAGTARERWERRGRLRAGLLSAAAVGLLAAAGLAHLRGLDRELEAVARARAAVSSPVAEASTARDAAESMGGLLRALRDLRPDGPTWSEVVAEVARTLPPSAYLDRLAATDRGLLLSGSARSPSSLVPRLEDSPLLEGVTLESVSRAGGTGGDAFQIVARLSAAGPHRPGGTARGREGTRGDAAGGAGVGDTTRLPRPGAAGGPP